jgi:ABC-2 type transport system ATP-binding protein
MIKVDNLGKRFNELWAVRELNLEIGEGEIFAFLGPNGAGKTTTIKLLTGLLKPTTGKVYLGGYDLGKERLPALRLVSYISDQPYLYDKLSGREFLKFIGELYGVKNLQERMEDLLEIFELSEVGDRLIEDYSHGMRQKLIFSASLLHAPRLIIIDEPMVGLDPKSVRLVKDILRRKAREGVTIFLSTHTLSVAEELASRIGIIDQGRLIALGTLAELKARAKEARHLEDIFLELTTTTESDIISGIDKSREDLCS